MKFTVNILFLTVLVAVSVIMFYYRFPQDLIQWILFGIVAILILFGFINEWNEERKRKLEK